MSNSVYPYSQKPSLAKYFAGLVLLMFVFALGWNVGLNQQKAASILPGENTVQDPYGKSQSVDMSVFWGTWGILNQSYVDVHALDTQEMVYGAIHGMVQALGDPYTVFMTPKESKEFQDEVEGAFEGIGVEITLRDNLLVVVSPLKNSPAKLAGLQPEDIITHIDGKDATEMSLEEAAKMIRGPKGSHVKLTLLRKETQVVELDIERRDIKVNSVEWKLEKENIALIEVNRFNGETMKEFNKAVTEILAANVQGIILDLRFNSGGVLEASTEMASAFLEGKNKKIVTIKKRDSKDDEVIYATGQGHLANLPMVVLINPGTASASEIVAGALQDHKRATIVGEQSFGKGTVQAVESLPGGASIRVTIAKWFTPNDTNISETGITPDVEVKMTLEDYQNDKDPQMDKAYEILAGKM